MSCRRLTIREVVAKLSLTQDLFADSVSESYVIEAGRRWLRSPHDEIWKVRVLQRHASTLFDYGYPGLAAQLITDACLHLARTSNTITAFWRECVTEASLFWQASGRLEEKQSVMLRLSGVALKAGKQRFLFPSPNTKSQYQPLWLLAWDFDRSSDYLESASTFDTLYLETMAHDDLFSAARAALNSASEYYRLESWSECLDRAITAIETEKKSARCTQISFRAHVLAGISLFKTRQGGELMGALHHLLEAKRTLRKIKARWGKKDDRQWLFHWLGHVYLTQGLSQFGASNRGANRVLLRQADRSIGEATRYLTQGSMTTREFIGKCLAFHGEICRIMGDRARADELESRAMGYGFMS